MARPIKETPVLKGKDVERFKYNLEHPTPVSAEEVTKARETYEKFKRITTFVLWCLLYFDLKPFKDALETVEKQS